MVRSAALTLVVLAGCQKHAPEPMRAPISPAPSRSVAYPRPLDTMHRAIGFAERLGTDPVDAELAPALANGMLAECALSVQHPTDGIAEVVFDADGKVVDAHAGVGDVFVSACVKDVLLRVPWSDRGHPTAGTHHLHIALGPRPEDCTLVYPLGDHRACVRTTTMDVVDVHGAVIAQTAPRRVLDASFATLILDGACRGDELDRAGDALCVVAASETRADAYPVYVSPSIATRAGFPRRAVSASPQGGVLATNGLAIELVEDTNRTTYPEGDVQAGLVADRVRTDTTCARWYVREGLRWRDDKIVMTFADCARHDVRVQLLLGEDRVHYVRL